MNIFEILKTALGILAFAFVVYFITNSLRRLLEVAAGQALFGIYNILFDFGLWPIIQEKYGISGVVGLTILATIMNLCILFWYKKTCKTDWLGIDIVHEIVAKAEHARTAKKTLVGFARIWYPVYKAILLLSASLIKGKWAPLLYLALFHDSFLATAYYINWKHKTVNVELGKDGYIVFFVSTLVSCIGWSVFTALITLPAFRQIFWQG